MIVPKPVLDREMTIAAYCFRYQRGDEYLGDQPARLLDGVINLPCLTILEEIGLNGFTNGNTLFVPINKFTLLSDVTLQCSQPSDKIIFLLDENLPPEDMFLDCIKVLREKGFRFAVEKVRNYEYMRPVIELCDYIMISFKFGDMGSLEEYKQVSRQYRKHLFIATDVDKIDVFQKIRYSGFDNFEGQFYNVPANTGHNTIAPVKVNRIQLINIVREPDFSIEEVVGVVSKDPSLSFSLLKLVNSPYLGLSQKIKSIQHAVAMLGQTEVRKWVTTATTGLLADDKPDALTRVSLVRARFAENLARYFEMAIHAPGLFLMGLFSVLDVVLEMDMEEALKIISVSERIHDALVHGKGDYASVLQLIQQYEAANWTEVNRLMTLSKVRVEDVFKSYIEAVRWYDTIAFSESDEQHEQQP